MKKSLLAVFFIIIVVFTIFALSTDAKTRSGGFSGTKSSSPSISTTTTTKPSVKTTTEPSQSTATSSLQAIKQATTNATESSQVNPRVQATTKPVVTSNAQANVPARKKVRVSSVSITPYTFKNKPVYINAIGAYVVFYPTYKNEDCDFEDLMEGDEDCKEMPMTNDEIATLLGEEKQGEPLTKGESIALTAFALIVLVALIGMMIGLTIIRNGRKKR